MDDAQENMPHNEPETSPESALLESAGAMVHPGQRLAWENYLRCLFLMGVLFVLGVMTWRPGLVRLSLLRSLTNPTRGESLAWKPEPEPIVSLPEAKRVRPPAEWRLSASHSGSVFLNRPQPKSAKPDAGRLSKTTWHRYSTNPWRWQDDAKAGNRRNQETSAAQPPQKPESSFRAGDIAAWPRQTTPAPTLMPPAQTGIASLPELPQPSPTTTTGSLASPLPAAPANQEPARLPEPLTQSAPATSVTREMAGTPPSPLSGTATHSPQASSATAESEIDWKNREITGPIPGAYLTIYPKLKFVGLCVPGQGYIRKYNQIGVPADLTNPKMNARDSRTPYGKYFIADRHRDADGPRLYLSWPSPDDARRIGLDPGQLAEVDQAWRTQSLPPQDTAAGGGVGLNGLRHWVDTTEGGFALEEPHMEEIFIALPDKAWVFVQN